MRKAKPGFLAIASLVLAMSGTAAHALIAVDGSGTLLTSDSRGPSAFLTSAPSTGALTLENAFSPTTSLLRNQHSSSAQLLTIALDSDFLVTGNEPQPVSEASTWFAAAIGLATILYIQRRKLHGALAFCFARH
jgi:hypothetical protein